MKQLIFVMLTLVSTAVEAQTYKCPSDNAGAALSSADIRVGAKDDARQLHGDVDQFGESTTIRVNFSGEAPRWLVCQYGGQRVEGTAISGPRAIGAYEIWVQLDPLISACELSIRRTTSQRKNQRSWAATATCKRMEPPPSDLV